MIQAPPNAQEMPTWERAHLKDVVIFRSGHRNSDTAVVDGEFPFFICSNEVLRSNEFDFDDEVVVMAGNNADGVFHLHHFNGKFAARQRTYVITPSTKRLDCRYLFYQLGVLQRSFQAEAIGTTTLYVTIRMLRAAKIPLPKLEVQRAIAEALSDADAFIESLEQLLAKKRQIKQGAMQELLTGKKRLPGFSGKWNVKRIAEIASLRSEKNSTGEALTVLTCSKHVGFVDSLSYFKNQVFSRDTSGYKVIRRGEIGYPSNHVEEGSIGLQDLYDVALVSPIYVVFSIVEGVNSFFFHRLLKLDSYRQEFATATSSSVDRRGSLRWPTFSEIIVRLPRFEEQTAIAVILSDMDAEIAVLEAKLAKARNIKQGMMQELLTGRIRLV